MSRPTAARRIIVGVDRSFAGMQALRRAVQLARRDGAQVDAVRAWVFAPTWRPGTLTWHWQDECDRAALAYLRGVFDAALGGMPGDVAVRLVAAQGYAGQVLVDHADRESDLLVVGSPERGRFGRSRGHVTRYCVKRAVVPVIAVPAPSWARAATIRRFSRDLERFSH
ncbi:universal stress protein [Micromonospora sp. WMMD710]|uniref:universal stress protein n=1 Tax=unclassified Micromonospora TaxID=2617518 RepID=UPI00241717C0|nr:universal stress protein [Micromonospora sp. WMMD710]MDG4760583.1 universal stress protein [Micromonospora sp. WMMD710]